MSEVFLTAGSLGGPGSLDGPIDTALFRSPTGIAIDKTGNMYVSDRENYAIRKISSDGIVSTIAGHAGDSRIVDGKLMDARFFSPGLMSMDNEGNLYVDDSGKIRKISTNGTVSTLATLGSLSGFTVGVDGSIYFVDSLPEEISIRMLTPSGSLSTLLTIPTSIYTGVNSLFSRGIAVDQQRNVYFIADGAMQKLSPQGQVTRIAGLPAERAAQNIQEPVRAIDGKGDAARFGSSTETIQIDAAGNLYVVDSSSYTIRKVTPDGVVTTVAGISGSSGDKDGDSNTALISPISIALDGNGDLYITGSGKVRKLNKAGEITTVAGRLSTVPYDASAEEKFYGVTAAQKVTLDSEGTINRIKAADKEGNIYIVKPISDLFSSSAIPDQIRKIAPDGSITNLGEPTIGISQVTVNYQGQVFALINVCNIGRICAFVTKYTVARLESSGKWTELAWGGEGTPPVSPNVTRIDGPIRDVYSSLGEIAADSSGNIYLTRPERNAVLKITPQGQVVNFAGGRKGTTDGPGDTAEFSNPTAIAVDPDNAVLVYDAGNNTIRRVAPDGKVATLAGMPMSYGTRLGKAPNSLPELKKIRSIGPNVAATLSNVNRLEIRY